MLQTISINYVLRRCVMKPQAILLPLIVCSAPVLAQENKAGLWHSGLYAGINAGFGVGTSSSVPTMSYPVIDGFPASFNNVPDPSLVVQKSPIFGGSALANTGIASVNQSGVIGGGQIGYNYLLTDRIIIGAETDFQGSGIGGSGRSTNAAIQNGFVTYPYGSLDVSGVSYGMNNLNTNIEWIGTVRGRAGALVTNSVLIFGTGGLAYASISGQSVNSQQYATNVSSKNIIYGDEYYGSSGPYFPGYSSNHSINTGWTVGGGAEWMASSNWSLKAEALYYDLGKMSLSAPTVVGDYYRPWVMNYTTSAFKYDGVIARFGLNYHFGK